MSGDLGEFEGFPIVGHELVLKGTGSGLEKAVAVSPVALHKGDIVDILIRARAGDVLMKEPKDQPEAWLRVQNLTAQTITIVNRDVSDDLIEAQRVAEEKKLGIVRIPFESGPRDKGPVVHTDASGVVLTDAEYAELVGRGEPVLEVSPVIVEFEDDESRRLLWPDEFAFGSRRLAVGDEVFGEGFVTALIDPVTGVRLFAMATVDDLLDGEIQHADGTVAQVKVGSIEASDLDPALVVFLDGSASEVKGRVGKQLSVQFLDAALETELAAMKPRPAVVNSIKERLQELDQ